MSTSADQVFASRDIKAIGLVSTSHFFSHFYMLMLPPLFPLLTGAYGIGFTELGIAMTVYSLATGLTQAPMGFLVDRYGARGLLIAGLLIESVVIALIGVFPTYSALIACMAVAGIANSVFHPADYAILSASVRGDRVGRAFSVHTFAGHLGNAVAPVVILSLVAISDWRTALVVCGAGGGLMCLVLAANSGALTDVRAAPATAGAAKTAERGDGRTGLKLLFSVPILVGLLFFVGISISQRGMTHFGLSAVTLIHDVSIAQAGIVLSAYLVASPIGVLAGGWIADHIVRHDVYAASAFAVIAAAVFTIAAVPMPMFAVAALFAVAGFFAGTVAPSRDMLIRSMTPPGEMGKVFGFVSTGFSIGGILAPPAFGYLLDRGEPALVFWTAGVISLVTIGTIFATGHQARGTSTTTRQA